MCDGTHLDSAPVVTPGDFDVRAEPMPDGGMVLTVTGELDLATTPRLEDALLERPPGERLVIDLSACTFLDSSGVRVLATSANGIAAEGSRLELVVTDSGIARVLEITGIDTLIDVHSSLEPR
jgi:anti-sigma B factor antagonist